MLEKIQKKSLRTADVLEEIAKYKGITQREIAEMLDLDTSTMSYYKTKGKLPAHLEGILRKYFNDIIEDMYARQSQTLTSMTVKMANEKPADPLEQRVKHLEEEIRELKKTIERLLIAIIEKK